MTKAKRVNPNVDTNWFKAELDKRGYTHRFVADKLGMGYPDFSRCINGDAHFEIQELLDLAKLLSASFMEILSRIGVENPNGVAAVSATQVPVTGRLDGNGRVVQVENGGTVSSGVSMAVEALRVSSLGALDTATLFLDKARDAASCVGRLCKVEFNGRTEIRFVKRGSDDGLYMLTAIGHPGDVELDVRLETAQPVIWAKL